MTVSRTLFEGLQDYAVFHEDNRCDLDLSGNIFEDNKRGVWAKPRDFIATMGMPIREDGTQECEDVTLATRNALLNMIDLLQERVRG